MCQQKKILFSIILAIGINFIWISGYVYAAENRVPKNFVAPSYIYTKEDVVVDRPIGRVINDRPEDPLLMQKTGTSSANAINTIYGPYYTLVLDDSKMQVIFSSLRSGSNIVSVIYNGVNCFKFTSGSNTIYIAYSAMTKVTSGICDTISSTLTSNLNNKNTDWVYTNVFKSYQYSWNGYTIYRLSLARIGVQVFYNSSNQIYMSTKVFDSIAVDVFETFIEGLTYTSELNITPTSGVKITNTGTGNSMYFGGYEIQGQGENTSTTGIENLVELGYKASQAIGSITNLSFSTIYGLYNDFVSLSKSDSGSRKFYCTTPVSLSNPYLLNGLSISSNYPPEPVFLHIHFPHMRSSSYGTLQLAPDLS